MTDIKNTEYITINKDGIFVGGKPATHYRGQKIVWTGDVCKYFAAIQELNPNIVELHVLSSETSGIYAVAGNPSEKYGPNAWCRVLLSDGRLGAWVFVYTLGLAANYAGDCANICAVYVLEVADFRSAVFGAVDKEKTPQKPINPVRKMTRNEVLHKVIEIVNEHKSADFLEVTENSRLSEDLGMDSLDIVETGMDIERRLGIVFDTDEFEEVKFNLKSVKDMVNFTCKKLNIPVNNAEKKSNLRLNMLYPIIAALLFVGCNSVDNMENVVVVPGKNKIIVKDVKDGQERIFFTNKSDNRFQRLNVGDTINVRRNKGYGDYNYYRVFDDDDKFLHIDVNDLHVAQEKFRFDSIKNKMLMDSVAQNKR